MPRARRAELRTHGGLPVACSSTGTRPGFCLFEDAYATHPFSGCADGLHNSQSRTGTVRPAWLPRLDLSLIFHAGAGILGPHQFSEGGIVDSDIITTVSRKYASEIRRRVRARPTASCGAAPAILSASSTDRHEQWDPAHDPFLPTPYGPHDLSERLQAKKAVLAAYDLPVGEQTMARPLVAMISRMIDPKGFDLVASIADELPRLDATFVLLGTGDARYQDLWRRLATLHRIRLALDSLDETAAHLIEGGADMFLMPSRFEPCGLNQMYSLRYGTVPVVRAVGGLADTVHDYAQGDLKSTGFVFEQYTGEALLGALRRALALFGDPGGWHALQAAGMKQDNSWDRSAREYVKIYERAIERAGGGRLAG